MALANSINSFRKDLSDATSRNIAHSRPTSTGPPRTSTPKPSGTLTDTKRSHDDAFSTAPTVGGAGREVLTQVLTAVKYLKEKEGKPITFDNLIGYLSLPNDTQKNIPNIKRALQGNERVEYLSKAESGLGKEAFKYRPLYPVTNDEELKSYLATHAVTSAAGIKAQDLKDGWPDCAPHLDQLEKEGYLLITRNKKDNTPKFIYPDNPNYHILNASSQLPQKIDADFVDVWAKTKLPASEIEIRNELEKAGLTPTSQVKEVKKFEVKRKEKRRVNRKGGKTTNSHMLGILKDYSKR